MISSARCLYTNLSYNTLPLPLQLRVTNLCRSILPASPGGTLWPPEHHTRSGQARRLSPCRWWCSHRRSRWHHTQLCTWSWWTETPCCSTACSASRLRGGWGCDSTPERWLSIHSLQQTDTLLCVGSTYLYLASTCCNKCAHHLSSKSFEQV